MARRLGVAARTYANYERDERLPDAAALTPLAEQGWNVNWLLTGDGPQRLEDLQIKGSVGDVVPSPSESQAQGLENLKMALTAVEEALDAKSAYLPPARRVDAAIVVSRLMATGLADAEVSSLAGQMIDVMVGTTGENDGGKAAAGGPA